MNKRVITLPPPNQPLMPAPDFIQSDFNDSVWNKGYRVIHEKTIKCPCKSKSAAHLSNCQNCQGTGWIVIDATETKMLMTSINSNTKYKVWSEENSGTVSITADVRDKLAFMDKIKLLDSKAYMSELLYTQEYNGNYFTYTVYDIVGIVDIFLFHTFDQPLLRLIRDVDFTISGNKIIMLGGFQAPDLQISIKYEHNIVYGVVDLPHDVRNSYTIDDNGADKSIVLPVQAIGKRFHYLIDSQNFEGDNLFDNSLLK